MMSKLTLIVVNHDADQIDPATARVATAAAALGGSVQALVFGSDAVAQQCAAIAGISKVLHHPLVKVNAETVAKVVHSVQDAFDAVVASHSMMARAALPRAAALSACAFLTDVIAIQGEVFTRPMYAGSVMASVCVQSKVFLTVRASAFEPAPSQAPAEVSAMAAVPADGRTELIGKETASSSRPDLTRARVVVAGGRGVGSAENMRLVEALADKLGGAVGASRAAVDAGFAPNALQVGQTGKTVAPDIYIAAGISGAIQHVAGIKDAKVIVAINKDPDAPIFSIADVGLVGDLFEVLPALTAGLPSLSK